MNLRLNELKPAKGSRKKHFCVGRGVGSGMGKTCGKGHKGQKAKGGKMNLYPQGGQTPLHRRFPKFGFYSKKSEQVQELYLSQLAQLPETNINLALLREKKLINPLIKSVKVIFDDCEPLKKALNLSGIRVTQKVKGFIESAGGKVG